MSACVHQNRHIQSNFVHHDSRSSTSAGLLTWTRKSGHPVWSWGHCGAAGGSWQRSPSCRSSCTQTASFAQVMPTHMATMRATAHETEAKGYLLPVPCGRHMSGQHASQCVSVPTVFQPCKKMQQGMHLCARRHALTDSVPGIVGFQTIQHRNCAIVGRGPAVVHNACFVFAQCFPLKSLLHTKLNMNCA